jgi:hypothetical protein
MLGGLGKSFYLCMVNETGGRERSKSILRHVPIRTIWPCCWMAITPCIFFRSQQKKLGRLFGFSVVYLYLRLSAFFVRRSA